MEKGMISPRRRRFLIAGAAVPATVAAARWSFAQGGPERFVVSGRIVDADGQPLAGARVETPHAGGRGTIGTATDGDGRFVLESESAREQPARLHYRVSSEGYRPRSAVLEAARMPHDESGVKRGTFALILTV